MTSLPWRFSGYLPVLQVQPTGPGTVGLKNAFPVDIMKARMAAQYSPTNYWVFLKYRSLQSALSFEMSQK